MGGAGSRVKILFFLVLYYVIALVISFPKWAHLSPNSQRFPRYDATKLGTTRAILAICIGKMGKIARVVPNFDASYLERRCELGDK